MGGWSKGRSRVIRLTRPTRPRYSYLPYSHRGFRQSHVSEVRLVLLSISDDHLVNM